MRWDRFYYGGAMCYITVYNCLHYVLVLVIRRNWTSKTSISDKKNHEFTHKEYTKNNGLELFNHYLLNCIKVKEEAVKKDKTNASTVPNRKPFSINPPFSAFP